MKFILIICIPKLQMAKRGPMHTFNKPKHPVTEPRINFETNGIEVLQRKRIRTGLTQKYASSYIQFGLIATDYGVIQKPQCIICGEVLDKE